MARSRFKTKLSKRQKQKNLWVFLLVVVLSYAFVLFFCNAIGVFEGWTLFEVLTISLFLSFFALSMLLFPVLIAAVVLGFQKGTAKRVRDDSAFVPVQDIIYYRDNLGGMAPSLVSLLIDLDLYGKKDIAATLLRMQNKKVICVQENGGIIATDENVRELDSGEWELLNMVKCGKLNDKRLLSQWKQNRFRDAERLGYIKKQTVNKGKAIGISLSIAVLSLAVAIGLWVAFLSLNYFENMTSFAGTVKVFAALLTIDLFAFVPFYFGARKAAYYRRGDVLWERTPLGNETAEKIAGLGQFINDFSRLSEAKKEEAVLWEDYLVYAIVLEENEQIVQEISKRYNFSLA